MPEYSDVKSFWNKFEEEFNEWLNDARIPNYVGPNTEDDIATEDGHEPHGEENKSKKPIEKSREEYCHKYISSYCSETSSKCEDTCDIHMIEPCEKIWSPLVEKCCGMCDYQCEAENETDPSINSNFGLKSDNCTNINLTTLLVPSLVAFIGMVCFEKMNWPKSRNIC